VLPEGVSTTDDDSMSDIAMDDHVIDRSPRLSFGPAVPPNTWSWDLP